MKKLIDDSKFKYTVLDENFFEQEVTNWKNSSKVNTFSNDITVGGHKWRIILEPNNTKGFLSFRLCCMDFDDKNSRKKDTTVYFKFVLYIRNYKDYSITRTNNCCTFLTCNKEYNKFNVKNIIEYEDLYDRKKRFLEDDKLVYGVYFRVYKTKPEKPHPVPEETSTSIQSNSQLQVTSYPSLPSSQVIDQPILQLLDPYSSTINQSPQLQGLQVPSPQLQGLQLPSPQLPSPQLQTLQLPSSQSQSTQSQSSQSQYVRSQSYPSPHSQSSQPQYVRSQSCPSLHSSSQSIQASNPQPTLQQSYLYPYVNQYYQKYPQPTPSTTPQMYPSQNIQYQQQQQPYIQTSPSSSVSNQQPYNISSQSQSQSCSYSYEVQSYFQNLHSIMLNQNQPSAPTFEDMQRPY